MDDYLLKQEENMIQLLERLVNIDSGSLDVIQVNQLGNVLHQLFTELDLQVTLDKQVEVGDHLIIRSKHSLQPSILILTHMDTVFEKGTVKQRPFHRDAYRAYGPGVIDMKASLVSIYFVLKTLKKFNRESLHEIELLITTDEEIGSVHSRELIEKHAANKKYCLVLEPARKNGAIVSARRGKGNFTLEVKGKAAHSGIEPERGRSAIEELAYKIIELHDITDEEEGINVNVGLIEGGTSANTISDHAVAQVDVRFRTQEQAVEIEQKLTEIMSNTEVDGTKINFEGEINRPPMEKNEQTEKLLRIIKQVGDELQIFIKDTETGGASDASFPSALGVPTVDGLGPIGGNPHRKDEYLELSSFIPRTLLLLHIIEELIKRKKTKS